MITQQQNTLTTLDSHATLCLHAPRNVITHHGVQTMLIAVIVGFAAFAAGWAFHAYVVPMFKTEAESLAVKAAAEFAPVAPATAPVTPAAPK